MSRCEALAAEASGGVAAALRAVDCLSNEMAASAFGRLFGAQGALLPALTILLTLYIALFAFALITGRSRLGVSALTPRMMTLGLVLTFATSWLAWQGVVWNLAIGAPDQLAGILLGSKESATMIFSNRLDAIFAAIADIGTQSTPDAEAAVKSAADGGAFSPSGMMWLAAILLLLGTVGVLLTARIALAVLLALGPIFVVLGLFGATRGLTAGWLRGLVLTALTPLFVVAGGSLIMELLVPIIGGMAVEQGIDARGAMALFVVSAVHVALMAMVLKVAGTMVSGWQVFGLAPAVQPAGAALAQTTGAQASSPVATPLSDAAQSQPMRRAALVTAAMMPPSADGSAARDSAAATHHRQTISLIDQPAPRTAPRGISRAHGVGSRFRAHQPRRKEMFR